MKQINNSAKQHGSRLGCMGIICLFILLICIISLLAYLRQPSANNIETRLQRNLDQLDAMAKLLDEHRLITRLSDVDINDYHCSTVAAGGWYKMEPPWTVIPLQSILSEFNMTKEQYDRLMGQMRNCRISSIAVDAGIAPARSIKFVIEDARIGLSGTAHVNVIRSDDYVDSISEPLSSRIDTLHHGDRISKRIAERWYVVIYR